MPISPVIIALTIRRKVYIPAGRSLGCYFVIQRKLLPQVVSVWHILKDVCQDTLYAMPKVLQHASHITLIVKAHDDEAA